MALHGSNLGDEPAADTLYEAYYKTFTLSDYDRAINDAIKKTWPRLWALKYDTSITTVTNTWAYDLPPSVTLPLLKVEVQDTTTYATYPYTEMAFWRVLENGATRQIQFDNAQTAGYAVRLTYLSPVSTLETTLTNWMTPIEYVVLRAAASLYTIFLGKPSRADRVQVGENAAFFGEEAEYELRKVERQRPATKVRIAYPWAR